VTEWVRIGVAIAARPELWPTAWRQVRRLAAPGWWRRAPFLPVPSGAYLRFRVVTQYGETQRVPSPGDVLNYLAWCRRWERLGR
jgi:hypothetical protein